MTAEAEEEVEGDCWSQCGDDDECKKYCDCYDEFD